MDDARVKPSFRVPWNDSSTRMGNRVTEPALCRSARRNRQIDLFFLVKKWAKNGTEHAGPAGPDGLSAGGDFASAKCGSLRGNLLAHGSLGSPAPTLRQGCRGDFGLKKRGKRAGISQPRGPAHRQNSGTMSIMVPWNDSSTGMANGVREPAQRPSA